MALMACRVFAIAVRSNHERHDKQPMSAKQVTSSSAKRMQLRFVYARATCSTVRALMPFSRKDKADMPYAWRWPS